MRGGAFGGGGVPLPEVSHLKSKNAPAIKNGQISMLPLAAMIGLIGILKTEYSILA